MNQEQVYEGTVAKRLLTLTSGSFAMELRDDGIYMAQDFADIVAHNVDWMRWNPQWELLESDPLNLELLPVPFTGRQLAAFLLCPVASELTERFGDAGALDEQAVASCFKSKADGMCRRAIEDAYSHLARAAGVAGTRESALFEMAQRLGVEYEDKRDAARARLGIKSVTSHGLSDAEYRTRIEKANSEVAPLKDELKTAKKRAEAGELDWLRRMVLALFSAGDEESSVRVVPLQRARAQDEEILQVIRKMGHEPTALPRGKPGVKGVKSIVRQEIGNKGMWEGKTVFDHAWDRLRANSDIAEAAI